MDITLSPTVNGERYTTRSDVNKWLSRLDPSSDINRFYLGFELYLYSGVRYLKVAPGYQWAGTYLSCNNNGYLGLYPWSGACGWAISGDALLCQWNGQPVCLMPDGFFRAVTNTTPCSYSRLNNEALYQALGM